MLHSLNIHLHAVIAGAALFSAPALAGAQTAADAPVAVAAVHTHNGETAFEATGRTFVPNTVDVRFQNVGTKPIARIVFDVRSGSDDRGTIVDVGHIAPGAAVARHYENTFDVLEPLRDAAVAPVEVDFADGSVWKASD